MMMAFIRRNLTCLFSKKASSLCKSYTSISPSLHFFSTSTKSSQLVASPLDFNFLLNKHRFSPQVASQVALVLTQHKNPENADSIMSFLKESGFSNAQLEKIVRYRPRFLLASLDRSIRPKIKIFQDLGFCSNDIAKIISSNPLILQLNVNTRVIPSLSVLKSLLGSNSDVAKLLRKSGWFLIKDLEKTMMPNIEFLRKSCDIPMERLLRLLYSHPRCLLLKPEQMKQSVEKAEDMGANRSSNMFIYGIRVVASMTNKTLELKLQALRDFGFSGGNITTMFEKAPLLFAGSVNKIQKTKDFLIGTGKYDLSCIVNNPISLACSLEKRYKPRVEILRVLENKHLIKEWPSLGSFYAMSDEKFFEKFVSPYLNEVGELYVAKSSVKAKREKKVQSSLKE